MYIGERKPYLWSGPVTKHLRKSLSRSNLIEIWKITSFGSKVAQRGIGFSLKIKTSSSTSFGTSSDALTVSFFNSFPSISFSVPFSLKPCSQVSHTNHFGPHGFVAFIHREERQEEAQWWESLSAASISSGSSLAIYKGIFALYGSRQSITTTSFSPGLLPT